MLEDFLNFSEEERRSLQELDLSQNDLDTLKVRWHKMSISEALGQCTKLQRLDLSYTGLAKETESETWQAFCSALERYTNLQELNLENNFLGYLNEVQWQAFCNALEKCTNLQELNIEDNDLTQARINHLNTMLGERMSINKSGAEHADKPPQGALLTAWDIVQERERNAQRSSELKEETPPEPLKDI